MEKIEAQITEIDTLRKDAMERKLQGISKQIDMNQQLPDLTRSCAGTDLPDLRGLAHLKTHRLSGTRDNKEAIIHDAYSKVPGGCQVEYLVED